MAWGDSDYSGGEEASGGTEAPEWIPFSTTLVVRPPGLVGLLMGILSLTPFAVLVGFVTLIFFRRDLHTIFFLVGLLLNTVMNMILKPVIAQDRPDYNEHLRRYHGNSVSYGMPSHHSQFMWFFCFYMILFLMFRVKSVVPRGSGETAARQRWMYALFLLGAGASYSRVYLGYHTMEQVVVGAFVGSLFASAWFYIMQHYLSPCFLKILCHPLAQYFLIRDTTLIPNIMLFEYCNIQKAVKHRARARPDMSRCLNSGSIFCSTGVNDGNKPSCQKHESCF